MQLRARRISVGLCFWGNIQLASEGALEVEAKRRWAIVLAGRASLANAAILIQVVSRRMGSN